MPGVRQAQQQPLNTAGCVLLQQGHLPLHQGLPLPLHEGLQRHNPRLIGRHLRLQVGQQFRRVAGRRRHAAPHRFQISGENPALAHEQLVAQQQALIGNGATEGRH